eukprot:TRINITY_DN2795_c1_g3_i1.p1 TRINITY_DN2795_c1_g3~~TRINITY_DN2795_c1_g3_i1.p1  ORF type:complete len:289 (-),score=119.88 TRINITY_DN2795_c1_g3_i1:78-944(-)
MQTNSGVYCKNGKKISAIALDLDGTLLNKEKQISIETVNILRKLDSKGVHIILASGRTKKAITIFLRVLNIDCIILSCNGAIVHSKKKQNRLCLFHKPVPNEITQQLIKIATERRLHLNFYYENKIYSIQPLPENVWCAEMYSRASTLTFNFVENWSQLENYSSNKLLFIVTADKREQLYIELNQQFSEVVYIVKTETKFVEILNKETNKGLALISVCQQLNFPIDELIAFGDGNNDIEMLTVAGIGIAMANGTQSLKQVANIISEFTNNENAIAKELENLIDPIHLI